MQYFIKALSANSNEVVYASKPKSLGDGPFNFLDENYNENNDISQASYYDYDEALDNIAELDALAEITTRGMWISEWELIEAE